MFVTLLSSTCFEHQLAHLQEEKLHSHSICVSGHECVSGSGRIAPVILKFDRRWRSVVNLTFRPSYRWRKDYGNRRIERWLGRTVGVSALRKGSISCPLPEIEKFHLFVVVTIERLQTITYLQLSAVGGVTDGEIRVSGAPPTANQIGWVGSRTALGVLKKRQVSYAHRDSNPRSSRPWNSLVIGLSCLLILNVFVGGHGFYVYHPVVLICNKERFTSTLKHWTVKTVT